MRALLALLARPASAFRGTGAILYKETIHLRRDPLTLVIMFLIPTFQLVIFGYTVEMQVRDVPTVVRDLDHSNASRLFTRRLAATGTLKLVDPPVGADQEWFEDQMKASRVRVVVEIPRGFADDLLAGQRATVLVLIDGSDSTVANQAKAAVDGVAFSQDQQALLAAMPAGAAIGLVEVRPTMRFNPDMRSANFFVPGLLGIIMQVVTVFLTAAAIVREREKGTLEQLMVTPVSKGALMLGKLLPYAVIGLVETSLVVLIMVTVFNVPIHGSVPLLFALSVCFLFPALGLGILISTFARNSLQAMFGAMMTMLPAILLSGFIFPRASMPAPMWALGWLVPVTYYIEILRGIILKDAGLPQLLGQGVVLVAMGTFLLVVATARFHKRIG